jgi:hypothetical protein
LNGFIIFLPVVDPSLLTEPRAVADGTAADVPTFVAGRE